MLSGATKRRGFEQRRTETISPRLDLASIGTQHATPGTEERSKASARVEKKGREESRGNEAQGIKYYNGAFCPDKEEKGIHWLG